MIEYLFRDEVEKACDGDPNWYVQTTKKSLFEKWGLVDGFVRNLKEFGEDDDVLCWIGYDDRRDAVLLEYPEQLPLRKQHIIWVKYHDTDNCYVIFHKNCFDDLAKWNGGVVGTRSA